MKQLSELQRQANERIYAWLEGKPYVEYPGARARVPELKPAFVLKTYTPPRPEWSEQFFTNLVTAQEALYGLPPCQGVVLEPCAGIGNLVWAVQEQMPNARIHAYEIEAQAYRIGQKLFPKVAWEHGNVFHFIPALFEQYDLVVCNPPFRGGPHLVFAQSSLIPARSEHLFLQLAALSLRSGGQAVFIAPENFVEALPGELTPLDEVLGLIHTRSKGPLSGDFLQTEVRVYAHYFEKL